MVDCISDGWCVKKKPQFFIRAFIHTRIFVLALAAAVAAENSKNTGHADENVDCPFNHRPAAEEHGYDVQIAAKEAAETDEAPVDRTDDDESGRHFAEGTQTRHRNGGKGGE